MLALATGWTQSVIGGDTGEVSDDFRRACHWALFVKALVGDGLPQIDRPGRGATPEQLTAYARDARAVSDIRRAIFPEDEDG